MATAFTQREREQINKSLLDAALRCASTGNMKQATVDGLAREAGISKGAFYGFYDSKEHLFLSMLERLHNEMYGNAERVLKEREDLPIAQRVAMAVHSVCMVVEKSNTSRFLREEVPLLLRRLPQSDLDAHYRSDDELIRSLILKANVNLTVSLDTVCAIVRIIIMSLIARNDVGERYDEAIRLIIEGSCRAVIR